MDQRWAEGLDLLSVLGLWAAVLPHFDSAEGGTHATRFCYLGEQRLQLMETPGAPWGWTRYGRPPSSTILSPNDFRSPIVEIASRVGMVVVIPSFRRVPFQDSGTADHDVAVAGAGVHFDSRV
ncbi:MAG: hypothetical protein LC799_32120 [Actinobacteria bacterium]|nr:hypothetical protein [Actinomycetota bacterium]